jgi:tetratricopeptide (TPR) repeat protein
MRRKVDDKVRTKKDKQLEATKSSTDCSCSLAGTRYCDICESNPNKRTLKITSSRFSEFTSNIVVDGVRYHFQTEKLGSERPIILTTVFKGGEIVSSRETDYSHLMGDSALNEKLCELMHKQHSSVINMFKAEKPKERKMVSVYLEDVEDLLSINNFEGALKILDEALAEHPFNALLLSYYGYLDAIVNRNYNRGVDLCKTAIEILKEELRGEVSLGQGSLYSVFYLNLGRAYLAAGSKKYAVEAFKKGLEADPEDQDLLREVRRMGIRKEPSISFLKRSNPINKYIGRLFYN